MLKSFVFRLFVLMIVFLTSVIISCDRNPEGSHNLVQLTKKPVIDQVRMRGKLIAVTQYNSLDYFLYHGEPAGYQFEMLKAFAQHLRVELEVVVRNDLTSAVQLINSGQADIIAADLFSGLVDTSQIALSFPVGKTRLVVVQRIPAKGHDLAIAQSNALAGVGLNVAGGSATVNQIARATAFLPVKPAILERQSLDRGEIISKVAGGEIEFTVADEKTALTFASVHNNLDVSVPVGGYNTTHWGYRKGASAWARVVDNWLGQFSGSSAERRLYRKYSDPQALRRAARLSKPQSARLSDYDQLLKHLTSKLKWDWRLLAALIYQESKFNQDAVSHKGASGIMQLMPETAAEYGIDSLSTTPDHIVAGVSLLTNIDKQLQPIVADSAERALFVLAAYNVGIGHVLDARRLALKNGKNPNLWSDVEVFLAKKALPAYYSDEVVYYGYCRGDEPTALVKSVINRYNHYRNLISE